VNLLLLGPAGSGKGTQADRIAREYGIPHVSTGDMFRHAIAAGSELGRRVQPIYEAGELIPDDVTVALIQDRLAQEDARAGFVLDGFPRNLAQARELDSMLGRIGRNLDVILFFDLDHEIARERMRGRAGQEGRSDDTPEAIERRLEIYEDETAPVVEHYRTSGNLVPVHADRPIGSVWAEIQAALDQADGRAA
jgi:adenylate kinase